MGKGPDQVGDKADRHGQAHRRERVAETGQILGELDMGLAFTEMGDEEGYEEPKISCGQRGSQLPYPRENGAEYHGGRIVLSAPMGRSQKALASFFAFAGAMHFVIPRAYEAMMPPSLPRHREAVALSGVAEIMGGAAVIAPSTRRFARWWLLGLLLAVFPANVHMAVNPAQVRGLDLNRIPRWALWARLPLQPLAMLWVWRATRD